MPFPDLLLNIFLCLYSQNLTNPCHTLLLALHICYLQSLSSPYLKNVIPLQHLQQKVVSTCCFPVSFKTFHQCLIIPRSIAAYADSICFTSEWTRAPRKPRPAVTPSRTCAAGGCALSRWRARTRWRPRRCRSSGTLHLEAHSGRDTASVAWVHRVHVRANINVYLSGRELQTDAQSVEAKGKQSHVFFLSN